MGEVRKTKEGRSVNILQKGEEILHLGILSVMQ